MQISNVPNQRRLHPFQRTSLLYAQPDMLPRKNSMSLLIHATSISLMPRYMKILAHWLLAVTAVFLGAGVRCDAAQPEDEKLQTFFKKYLDERFEMRPMAATEMGDHRFDSRLEDLTPEARARWLEHARKTLSELPGTVDYKRLSRPAQIDYEILEHSLKAEQWLTENLHPFEEDPRAYNGYINDSIYLLLSQSSLPQETNISNCIARMAQIPKIVDAARRNLKNPPRVHTETAIKQNRGAIHFYEHDIFEFAGQTPQLEALKAAAAPVAACLKEYQTFLEKDLLPRANGEWRIGSEKFARKLDLELDAAVSADQVMADAQSEFDRVERDMYVVARQLWSHYFAGRVLPPDDQAGRRETVQRVMEAVSKEHCRPEELTRE